MAAAAVSIDEGRRSGAEPAFVANPGVGVGWRAFADRRCGISGGRCRGSWAARFTRVRVAGWAVRELLSSAPSRGVVRRPGPTPEVARRSGWARRGASAVAAEGKPAGSVGVESGRADGVARSASQSGGSVAVPGFAAVSRHAPVVASTVPGSGSVVGGRRGPRRTAESTRALRRSLGVHLGGFGPDLSFGVSPNGLGLGRAWLREQQVESRPAQRRSPGSGRSRRRRLNAVRRNGDR
jgi:hypothetical protein